MFKASFNYYSPDNLQKTAALLEQYQGKGKILAGGTDLLVALQKGKLDCGALIDIRKIGELKKIEKRGRYLGVGASVSFAELMCHPTVKKSAPLLVQASSTIGSPQIRNRGTVGGNLGTASPAGDLLTALVALEAVVILVYPGGRRRLVAVNDFLDRKGEKGLQANEIICEVLIPLRNKQNIRSAFVKLGRRKALAISRLSLALCLEMRGTTVTKARLSVGAAGPAPFRVVEAEEILTQKNPHTKVEKIMELVSQAVSRSLGERPSAPYKVIAVKGLVLEALSKCIKI